MKAASKAAVGLEEHHREVIATKGMENTPTLRTIASETKKSLLHRVDVSCCRCRCHRCCCCCCCCCWRYRASTTVYCLCTAATHRRNAQNYSATMQGWTVKVLEDALRLLILYSEKQLSLRSSKTDYCPKEESTAIEATRTVKVTVRLFCRLVTGVS